MNFIKIGKLLGFQIHDEYPTVIHLHLYLENGQRLYFTADDLNKPLADKCSNKLPLEIPSYYV